MINASMQLIKADWIAFAVLPNVEAVAVFDGLD
jgi:hypothetical protein